jgi:uncharacterized protein YqjF (DUF2071 family)
MSSVVMYQKWRELLFLHWPIEAEQVQASLPPGLTVDLFEGQAWLGLVPFRMRAIRPRFLPVVPHLSYFLETNVRTYVRDDKGRPGVWFYSLDANRRIAVWAARRFFSLPYFAAQMQCEISAEGWVDYRTARLATEQASRFRYRGHGDIRLAEQGSLEHFLVERYRLFAWQAEQRVLLTGEVEHRPYPLQDAERSASDSALLALAGFPDACGDPAHALFSPGVDVRVRRVEKA